VSFYYVFHILILLIYTSYYFVINILFFSFFFFFNDTATTEIYTLSLHDALPICSDDAPQWVSVNELGWGKLGYWRARALAFLIANACRESPLFATSTAFPAGVLISASPVTSSGARKPLSTAVTGVTWPCPSHLSHKPLPASS